MNHPILNEGIPKQFHAALELFGALDRGEGAIEDLSQEQVDVLRACLEDETGYGLYFFTFWVCGARDLYFPLHFPMCKFLSQWGKLYLADGTYVNRPERDGDEVTDSWRRLHVCIPRDHFKTTVATRANGLWIVTKNPELTVGIWNENAEKAKSWIGATRKVLEESKLYHTLWPHVLPKGIHFREREKGVSVSRANKWGDTGFVLERNSHMVAELTMEPFGISGASAGKHFTHVIKDDIIGDKAAESESVMNDAIEWVNVARALERPAEGGCELVNYTRWGYYDVYKHMLTKWKGQYKVFMRHMLENEKQEPDTVNGKVIFPTRFTTKQAKAMYEQDPFVFMSQYMVIPMSGRTTSFQYSWFREGTVAEDGSGEPYFHIKRSDYDPRIMDAPLQALEESAPQQIPLHLMQKAILLDPAPSKKSDKRQEPRARNGIVVVAKDPWNRRYCLDGVALKEDPVSVLQEIVRLAVKWSTYRIGIEEVCFSSIYAPLWERILYHEYPDVMLEWVALLPKGRDKDHRIFTMAGPMKEGFWYFNTPETGYVRQELLEFPNGETKDIIDAMSYTDETINRDHTPDELIEVARYDYEVSDGRSAITGY